MRKNSVQNKIGLPLFSSKKYKVQNHIGLEKLFGQKTGSEKQTLSHTGIHRHTHAFTNTTTNTNIF